MRVAVVGLGYVGLVTATCLARLGQEVVGLEADQDRLSTLLAGDVPYYEPNLAAELATQLRERRLSFTGDPAAALVGAEVVLVCVGTPSDATGHADLKAVLAVADAIAEVVVDEPVIVIRSTVPVGTTLKVEERINEIRRQRGLVPVAVLANPEFLRTGRAIDDFLRPSRVVIGRTDRATARELGVLAALYAPLEAPVVLCDAESAELTKNASNAFLAMRVSFVNELAELCHVTGADIDAVVAGMSEDPRIGSQFMKPGIGFGGSCLPKDVRSLIASGRDRGLAMTLATAVDAVNRRQPERVVALLAEFSGRPLDATRVGLLGLAFKPETDDIRDSPALILADELHSHGAQVVACDPKAGLKAVGGRPWLELESDPTGVANGADVLVLGTEWAAYVTADFAELAARMRGSLVIDGRNALDASVVEAAGLRYVGIGRARRGTNGRAGAQSAALKKPIPERREAIAE